MAHCIESIIITAYRMDRLMLDWLTIRIYELHVEWLTLMMITVCQMHARMAS